MTGNTVIRGVFRQQAIHQTGNCSRWLLNPESDFRDRQDVAVGILEPSHLRAAEFCLIAPLKSLNVTFLSE